MILVLAPHAVCAQRNAGAAPIDPIGTWRCVVYGNPSVDDERLLLRGQSWNPDRDGGARPACCGFVYRLDYRGEPSPGADQAQ